MIISSAVATFAGHQGIGDFIMTYRCVDHLARLHLAVNVICKPENAAVAKRIYREMPTVNVVPTDDIQSTMQRLSKTSVLYAVGYWRRALRDNFEFPGSFYDDMELPRSVRYTNCFPKPEDPEHPRVPARPYIFVADRSSTLDLPLYEALVDLHPNIPVVSADRNDVYPPTHPFHDICAKVVRRKETSICDYVDVIENAHQIHCIDSALWCLVDTVSPQKAIRKTLFVRAHCVERDPSYERHYCGTKALTKSDLVALLSGRRVRNPKNMIAS